MKEQFVPLAIAQKLKEKGFDQQCLAYYNTDPYLKIPVFNLTKPFEHEWVLPTPLWQQAIDWLKSKGILITELWNGWEYAKLEEDFTYVQTKEQAIEHALTLI